MKEEYHAPSFPFNEVVEATVLNVSLLDKQADQLLLVLGEHQIAKCLIVVVNRMDVIDAEKTPSLPGEGVPGDFIVAHHELHVR